MRHRVIAGEAALALLIDRVRDRLAQDVEPALEMIFVDRRARLADEDLHMHGLGRNDRLAKRRIVGRHVAPAEDLQAFLLGHVLVDLADGVAPRLVARQEQVADAVFSGRGQLEAELLCLAGEKLVRHLHQDAGAVAHARIGADRAAMFEIAENLNRVGDDLMRLLSLDVGDEADAAGILVERGIVETLRGRDSGVRRIRKVRGCEPRCGLSSMSVFKPRAHRVPRGPCRDVVFRQSP